MVAPLVQARMLSHRFALLALAFSTAACGAADPPATGTTAEADSATIAEDTATTGEDTGTTEEDTGTAKDTGVAPDTATATDTGCTMTAWYKDGDGDGYGDSKTTMNACAKPSGYVADKTDCDDTKAAVNPKASEVCDGADNNCDGTIDGTAAEAAACTASAGSYAGTYSMYTAEKLGSTIINQMQCTGTSSITINLAGTPVLKGTVICTYSGGLVAFDKTQTGTLEGTVKGDGTVDGKLTHKFGSSMTHVMTFTGKLAAGKVDVTGKSSWKPNPMSAVPWEITYSFSATKS